MKKLMMALLAVALCIAGAMAEDAPQYFVEGDYAYSVCGDEVILERCINAEPLPAEITLPTEIGGRPITAYDFVYHTSRTDGPVRVIVPEGVTDFGNAFGETSAITEIVLPASLSHIEEGSLYWGDAEITVHPDNPYFTCEDGFLIDTRTSTLLYVAPSGQNNPLPAVKRLGDICLYNWHAGETVHLPETLTSIGGYVFYDLVDLTHIDIPAGVTEIGGGAFNCAGLTEITLPAGLTAIEYLTFSCNFFTEIVIPDGVQYIDSMAFYLCPLTRVEIPASCTFVACDAFDPEVELVLLGDNTHVETERELEARERGTEHVEGNYGYALTENGAVITDCFWDEVVAAEIVVPDTLGGQPVIGVERSAFYDPSPDIHWPPEGACIRLPEGMQFLESGAFYACRNVREVHLPASLESIGENAFWYFGGDIVVAEGNPHFTCKDGFLIDTRTGTLLYAAVSAPDSVIPTVKRIGSRALDNQQLPADLVLSEGVEELSGAAFYDTRVRSVTLPESLRVIETGAFECVTVTSGRIVVPAGVEVVEYGAFGLMSPMDAEIIILGENTRVETAEEYFRRTGEVWVLEDDWEIEYTRTVPSPEENAVCIESGWEYAVTEEGAVITGFLWGDGASNEIVVPGTLGGLPVVGVDAFAFSTTDVKLDGSVACITLPEGLRFLDAEAFHCAHDIDAVHLPASLSEIPEGAFFHFEGEITVDAGNPHFVSENGFLTDTRTGTLLYAAPSSIGQALPAVRRYGAYALYAWGEDFDLPLVIPEGVEVIGQHGVYDFCYASVTLPVSLKTLETLAFQSVLVDTPIVVPAGVELLQYGAFGLDGLGAEVIVMSPATHIETAEEYAARTGEALEDVLAYTCELEYTPGWE